MLLEGSAVGSALKKVDAIRQVVSTLCPPGDPLVFSSTNLIRAIGEAYGVKVELFEVAWSALHVSGNTERRSDNTARIYVRSDLPTQWKRFVAIKELCHVMLDEQDDWSACGIETIESLLTEWRLVSENGRGHESPPKALQSEMLAEIAAIELLYPAEYRNSDIEKLKTGETTLDKIALEHEVPAFIIENALQRHETIALVRATILRN